MNIGLSLSDSPIMLNLSQYVGVEDHQYLFSVELDAPRGIWARLRQNWIFLGLGILAFICCMLINIIGTLKTHCSQK